MRYLLPAPLLFACLLMAGDGAADDESPARPNVTVRGVYGGIPTSLMEGDRTLAAAGVNAVWIGERGITAAGIARLRAHDARVFAEFNTLHCAEYLEDHPEAAPVGPDGERAEAPHGWQGICPTHEAYRRWRMESFRALLEKYELDGVWLDYHHAHASWERAEPALPDTCFCERCLQRFQADTGIDLEGRTGRAASEQLLGSDGARWVAWRCSVFTDWVREFRSIRDEVRPKALLGTFHCPWTADERDAALRTKLAIDLLAQSAHIDVFSPMPYHARFGHAEDPAWISRQTAWLGEHLKQRKTLDREVRIWPIVQLSDWGETVPVEQVATVIDHGTRPPSTGVMVFAWGSLRKKPAKVTAMVDAYRALAGVSQAETRPAEALELCFEPGEKGGRLAPRYSPKGLRVALAPYEGTVHVGADPLVGRLLLGPMSATGVGHRLVLTRSSEAKPYDRLIIDTDGDGAFEDEVVLEAKPSERRGSWWTSFQAVVHVHHDAAAESPREPYAIALWAVVEGEADAPSFMRFSRRGYLVAPVTLHDVPFHVVLSDANHDGVYGAGDWWALLQGETEDANDMARSRQVGDFAWAGQRAYRLELEGTRGRVGRLLPHDPGLTPEEDARKRDRYWDDKQAERAAAPVPFRHDVDAAIEEAKASGTPYFLDFETSWCGPCKMMDRWVYTAKVVTLAAGGIVCIKVDGDEREDLKERFGVSAFPTGILFSGDGEEIARFSGYRSVKAMTAFLAQARP